MMTKVIDVPGMTESAIEEFDKDLLTSSMKVLQWRCTNDVCLYDIYIWEETIRKRVMYTEVP